MIGIDEANPDLGHETRQRPVAAKWQAVKDCSVEPMANMKMGRNGHCLVAFFAEWAVLDGS